MPRIPAVSPATGKPTSSSFIHTVDRNFVDTAGRSLLLRGVNFSDVAKAPVDRPSYILEDFWDSAEAGGRDFIGRPLNLEDGSADVHLARLRGWGFNTLRYPFTWEALEHEGPGKYDHDFMDYTVRVLRKCKEYGFKVFMDPHQDVWSRFSGGSGAPYWTLAACGMNPRNFTATQGAVVHCEYPLAHDPDPSTLPAMIWSTNYGKLVSQTVFTLFYAGKDFAPRCIIDGKNIQDYLQDHYFAAIGQLAERIRDAGDLLDNCVIGWDPMNEPFEGFCGWPDLSQNPTKQGSTLRKGSCPTPAQSLRLGMGQSQTVDHFSWGAFGPRKDGTITVDPAGRSLWATREELGEDKNGLSKKWGWTRGAKWDVGTCLWALHGVWDIETGFILRPDYFLGLPFVPDSEDPSSSSEPETVAVEFIEDYWKPHWEAYAHLIRQSHPEAIVFVHPPVFGIPPVIEEEHLKGRCAYSGHYYDGLTLVTRHWNWFNADALGLLRGKYNNSIAAVKIGEHAIRKSLQEQLAMLKDDIERLGPYPTLIGEIGTPFDMDNKRSYGWTDNGKYAGDYSSQEKALDASLNGADGPNCINYTVWTYCPDSTHQWGDGWNMEDLSLWSADDLKLEGSNDSAYGVGDGSSAVLLGRQPADTRRPSTQSRQVSQLSLATIEPTSSDQSAARRRVGWHENPFTFLTNGARAVRASARPYPEKTVGLPIDIQFNAQKSEFKLVVRVRPEDAPVLRDDRVDRDLDDEKRLPTEIFLPLVHFAHPRLLNNKAVSYPIPDKKYSDNISPSSSTASRSSSPIPAEMRASVSSGHTAVAPYPNVPPGIEQTQPDQPSSPSSPTLLWTIEGQEELLDIEVTASAGTWAVHSGQTLKWWYDVPGQGEPDREYTIVVKRKGGTISTRDVSWTEQLCPEDSSCTVM